MAVFTKGIVPWNSLDDNTRLPLTSELEGGYPCGQADQQLFNFTTSYAWGQVHNAILESGLEVDRTDLTQLTLAIQAMIAEAIGNIPPPPLQAGRLLNVLAFHSSGTYTPHADATKMIVTCIGGGGGGGGGRATDIGFMSGGSGGGAGGVAKSLLTSFPDTISITIGAGGSAGGSAGANASDGGSGGTTSFGGILGATGGGGGESLGNYQLPSGTNLNLNGIVGGLGVGGNILNGRGGHGGALGLSSLGNLSGGIGGASHVSGPGDQAGGETESGASGVMGAGGGGGVSGSSPSAGVTGGAGGAGLIIVEEYS